MTALGAILRRFLLNVRRDRAAQLHLTNARFAGAQVRSRHVRPQLHLRLLRLGFIHPALARVQADEAVLLMDAAFELKRAVDDFGIGIRNAKFPRCSKACHALLSNQEYQFEPVQITDALVSPPLSHVLGGRRFRLLLIILRVADNILQESPVQWYL